MYKRASNASEAGSNRRVRWASSAGLGHAGTRMSVVPGVVVHLSFWRNVLLRHMGGDLSDSEFMCDYCIRHRSLAHLGDGGTGGGVPVVRALVGSGIVRNVVAL